MNATEIGHLVKYGANEGVAYTSSRAPVECASDRSPTWSPDGRRIVFTRRGDDGNYDIYTIRPDGTGLFRCTDHPSSDGHAVWTADGRIMWSGSQHGFRDEAALYEQTFQQYGQIYIMNADGSGKRLTDSRWEDSMPLYLPGVM